MIRAVCGSWQFLATWRRRVSGCAAAALLAWVAADGPGHSVVAATRPGPVAAQSASTVTTAVFTAGSWFIDRNSDRAFDPATEQKGWGSPSDIPVAADWNGDGSDELAVFTNGVWFIDRNGDFTFDPATEIQGWGASGWIPISGDWDGDGDADLGAIDPSAMVWFRDMNGDFAFDPVTEIHGWGSPGDIPLARDWNGDGKTSMGVFSGGVWFIDFDGDNAFHPATDIRGWGVAGWTPVAGDWDGDGDDDLGAIDPASMVWFRDMNGDFAFDPATEMQGWGSAGDVAVVADWNNDGRDSVGVYSSGTWFIDSNGDGGFDPATEQRGWGAAGWVPIPLRVPHPPAGPKAEGLVVEDVSDQWQTVQLSNQYSSAVIVCTPEYTISSPPAVVRMRNVTASSFDLKLQRLDRAVAGLNTTRTRCFAVEEGVYTAAADGIQLEAARFDSSVTDGRFSSWQGEARTYSNTYSSPVVLGQVMSFRDPRHSSFWARGVDRKSPPSPAALFVGKGVGEDSQTARANEVIGYIVLEAGVASIGSLAMEMGVAGGGGGMEGSPPYPLALTTTKNNAVLSASSMINVNGGQPVLHGPEAFALLQIRAAWDEDQFYDFERTHISEQVAFLAWTDTAAPNQIPVAAPQTVVTPHQTSVPITLTAFDPDLDPLAFTVTAFPAHGAASGAPPFLSYSPRTGYAGPDSLTFSVADGRGGNSQAVISILVGEAGNQPPAAVSQERSTPHDTALPVTIAASDPDLDPLTLSIIEQPGRGALSGVAPNFVYTPAPGFRGRDQFRFAAADGRGGFAEATVWVSVTNPVNQQQIVVPDADAFQQALFTASPGEEYLLAPGTYTRPAGIAFSTTDYGMLGTAQHPIIFRALDPANPPIIATVLALQSPQYVEFRDIQFVDPAAYGSNVNIYPVAHVPIGEVTFDGCYFQMRPEVTLLPSLKVTRIDNLFVRNSTFSGWGDNAIDTIGVWGGVIEANIFLGQPTHRQRTALQLKGDTRDLVVRNNYFENAGDRVIQIGGLTDAGSFRVPSNYEAERIDISGNRIVGGDACFVFSTQEGSRFHHNTCYLPSLWIARILQENTAKSPNRNGETDHNLFVYTGGVTKEFVNVGGAVILDSFTFDNNAFFQTDGDAPDLPRLPSPDANIVDQIDPLLIEPGTERMRIGSTDPLFSGIGADAVNPIP